MDRIEAEEGLLCASTFVDQQGVLEDTHTGLGRGRMHRESGSSFVQQLVIRGCEGYKRSDSSLEVERSSTAFSSAEPSQKITADLQIC